MSAEPMEVRAWCFESTLGTATPMPQRRSCAPYALGARRAKSGIALSATPARFAGVREPRVGRMLHEYKISLLTPAQFAARTAEGLQRLPVQTAEGSGGTIRNSELGAHTFQDLLCARMMCNI